MACDCQRRASWPSTGRRERPISRTCGVGRGWLVGVGGRRGEGGMGGGGKGWEKGRGRLTSLEKGSLRSKRSVERW